MKSLYKLYKKLGDWTYKLESLSTDSAASNNEWLIHKLSENIEKCRTSIQGIQNERMKSVSLEAIYFPFSRILDPISLRKAIFIFDKVWFLDPLGKEMRNVILEYKPFLDVYYPFSSLSNNWQILQKDYQYLFDTNQLELYDTTEIARDFEAFIGENLKKDVVNREIQSLFPSTLDTWALPKDDFPWESTKDVLRFENKFHLYYTQYTWIGSDRAVPLEEENKIPNGTNFIFVNSLQGASIKLSEAMIIGAVENIPLFTDKREYIKLLDVRITSGTPTISSSKQTFSSPSALSNAQARLAFSILDEFINPDSFAKMSFKEIVEYKNNCLEAKRRFNERLTLLCYDLETKSIGNEEAFLRVIDKFVLPEIQQYRDSIKEVYERMFGDIVDVGVKALITGLTSSALTGIVFPNFTFSQLFAMSVGVTSATILPTIPVVANLLINNKKLHRNAFVYLLDGLK